MDLLNQGIPLGRIRGIDIRVHITFVLYAAWQVQRFNDTGKGLLFIAGIYFCILLHEFGHAFAARWCDGDADEIIIWPLGGLAMVRPAFHPTAHLITAAAGPFVTLLLWLFFGGVLMVMDAAPGFTGTTAAWLYWFAAAMQSANGFLLLFNLIPAFPMDGGRILRDLVWRWKGYETATLVACRTSQAVALLGGLWALSTRSYSLVILCFFVWWQASSALQGAGFHPGMSQPFSIRDRLRRGHRRKTFQAAQAAAQSVDEAFHRCHTCNATEITHPDKHFRVARDGQEYCDEHLPA